MVSEFHHGLLHVALQLVAIVDLCWVIYTDVTRRLREEPEVI